MQYILILKKKINKLLTFYNYKSRARRSSYFYAFLLIAGLKEQQNFYLNLRAKRT